MLSNSFYKSKKDFTSAKLIGDVFNFKDRIKPFMRSKIFIIDKGIVMIFKPQGI